MTAGHIRSGSRHSRESGNPPDGIVAMKGERAGTCVQFRQSPAGPDPNACARPLSRSLSVGSRPRPQSSEAFAEGVDAEGVGWTSPRCACAGRGGSTWGVSRCASLDERPVREHARRCRRPRSPVPPASPRNAGHVFGHEAHVVGNEHDTVSARPALVDSDEQVRNVTGVESCARLVEHEYRSIHGEDRRHRHRATQREAQGRGRSMCVVGEAEAARASRRPGARPRARLRPDCGDPPPSPRARWG